MRRHLLLVTSIFMTSPAYATAAQVFTVPQDYATITAALTAAKSGDSINVNPGIYTDNLDFGGKTIALRAINGPLLTKIDVNGGIAVQISGSAEISGFTISGAESSFGAAVRVSGIGTLIQRNIFDGNSQTAGGFGAAIGGNGSSPTIIGNLFRNNSSDNQLLSGVVSFVNGSSPTIINNVFVDNNSRAINLTLPNGSLPRVINNTIVGNRTGIRVDRRISQQQLVFRNNLIVNNEIGFDVDFGSEGFNPVWENNLVFGNTVNYDLISNQTGLNGNISVDPRFIAVNDFRLLPDSPAIDAGSFSGAPLVDFLGAVRPFDGNGVNGPQIDIGAFEFVPEPSVVILIALGWSPLFMFRRRKSASHNRV
jgi:serine protease